MEPISYLELAERLQTGQAESEHRSAASRAYYAVYNLAYRELNRMGFSLPKDASAHERIYALLHNCGVEPVQIQAATMRRLRIERNKADYWHILADFPQTKAMAACRDARIVLTVLSHEFAEEDERRKIISGIKLYETKLKFQP